MVLRNATAIVRFAILLLLIGLPMFPGAADAWQFLACYQWDIFPAERYKLTIISEAAISDPVEEAKFNHPHQLAMTVVGKVVGDCGPGTVRPVSGTLITTDPLNQVGGGARLGMQNFNTTGFPETCKDVEISCVASDLSAFPPPRWDCFSQNKFPVEHPASHLIQVNETLDPSCSLFEGFHLPDPPGGGTAGGLP